MKVHKPRYYDKFICIADKCPFTCCQEWKIAVDDETKIKWGQLSIPSETILRNQIAMDNTLLDFVKPDEEVDSIRLCENGKCPLLNEKGLCDVVLGYGEETISKTCHTYPRENHEFGDCIEQTLAMGCPAALDLLFESEEFKYIESTNEEFDSFTNTETVGDYENETIKLFDVEHDEFDMELQALRDAMIEVIASDRSIETCLKMIFYIGLDCLDNDSVSIRYNCHDNEDVGVELFDEEFLRQLEDTITGLDSDLFDTYNEQNELFLDIADNYRKKGIYSSIIEPLAEIATQYEDEKSDELLNDRLKFNDIFIRTDMLAAKKNSDNCSDNLQTDKCLREMLRLLVQEELYSTLYLPGGDLYSMVMKLQWIAMTYAIIVHCLFLYWKLNGKLDYEDFRQIVAVIIRMTGYSEADIEEYLENSFEEIIWDWGYMALIMGEK